MSGRLVVCATPIGNLGDVTSRVLDALRTADLVAAEDTRVTSRLLARYGIRVRLEPYHARNSDARTPALLRRLREGAVVALVSDAGTPGISDPGAMLVSACIEAGVPVEVLPGPSAIVTALVASGLPTHAFYFGGFLPRKAGERRRALADLAALNATLVFYESPRRAGATAAALAEAFPGRDGVMARELTKVHEEVLRAPIGELADRISARELKGEIVLLVGPPVRGEREMPDATVIRAGVRELVGSGVSRSEAVKRYAAEHGLPRNAVYDAVHGGG